MTANGLHFDVTSIRHVTDDIQPVSLQQTILIQVSFGWTKKQLTCSLTLPRSTSQVGSGVIVAEGVTVGVDVAIAVGVKVVVCVKVGMGSGVLVNVVVGGNDVAVVDAGS